MPKTDEPKSDLGQQYAEAFKRQFRPDHSRAGRMTPRTEEDLDKIKAGEAK